MFQSTCFDLRPILILALTLLTSFAPVAALEVSKESEEIELLIGDDVIISWDGLAPDTLYRAAVTDEFGQLVSEVLGKSTPDGVLEPRFVWIGSGIVGCDDEGGPSVEYTFRDPAEAEAALKGRVFELSLADVETQTSVARFPMPMLAKDSNIFYFSDDRGCPRCEFDPGEEVFLTGMRVLHDGFWLFMVEEFEDPPRTGNDLEDVFDGPTEIWVPASSFILRLTSDLPTCRALDGVVRPTEVEGTETGSDPYWTQYDVIVDPNFCGADENRRVLKSIRVRPVDKEPCNV